MSDPRRVAWQALIAQRQGRNLPDALAAAGAAQLEPRERAFARRLAAHATRHRRRLEQDMQALLKRPSRNPELLGLLLLGAAQLDLEDIPDHAAVHATVALAPARWRGLVNAVLRRRLREAPASPSGWGEQLSFPDWLVDAIKRDWPGQAEAIMQALNQEPALCLRINRQQISRQQWLAALPPALAASPLGDAPSQCDGLRLQQAPALAELPGFDAGQVSVQGASAQAAASLLDLAPGLEVLDACAAPGGKTAHLLECEPQLRCVAMDVDDQRLARVAENLQRLQLQAELVCGDVLTQRFEAARFDRILLDVPCSGSGVIGRHPDIKWLRRASDIDALVATQQQMLAQAWRWLKPGGQLLYCSCSILHAENDAVLAAFVAAQADARLDVLNLPFGQASEYGWRVAPSDQHEGFYYARLTRT